MIMVTMAMDNKGEVMGMVGDKLVDMMDFYAVILGRINT